LTNQSALISQSVLTNAPIRQITPGVFQVGGVRLDQKARTASFPAVVNMDNGLIEYLLVHTSGKTHESLLKTDIEPVHLQVAMLLLGARGGPPSTNPPSGGQLIGSKDADVSPVPPGESVNISLHWQPSGREQKKRLEELVFNRKTKTLMTPGGFVFTGSKIWEGVFVAQREGSIVAVVSDPDAMFNNPRPGRDDDERWEISSKAVPPIGTPVQVSISLSAGLK